MKSETKKYRNLTYSVFNTGPPWRWFVAGTDSSSLANGVAASRWTAELSAKRAIDKFAQLEGKQIEAKLHALSRLRGCIDLHMRQTALLRQHVLELGNPIFGSNDRSSQTRSMTDEICSPKHS